MVTIDQVIAEKISEWTVNGWPLGNMVLCIIAVLLAVILCGAVGIERERRGHSAGLRTHLLVGVGSCLIMIISIYGFPQLFGEKRDVARLAAQVITGVGFLGAGAILHKNSGIRGLTTAATIWIVMAIGLACGSMNFVLATGTTILILVVLTFFRTFESKLGKKAPLVRVNAKSGTPVVSKVLELGKQFNCSIVDLQVELLEDDEVEVTFQLFKRTAEIQTSEFIAGVEAIEGVTKVGLLNNHKA